MSFESKMIFALSVLIELYPFTGVHKDIEQIFTPTIIPQNINC